MLGQRDDIYNYDEFVPEKFERWIWFDESPELGKSLQDFPLMTLDRAQTSLRTETNKYAYTVVEFGSFT
jgi:hypothetical protein